MALIKCPECCKNVSSQAESCPNCGYPLSGQNVWNDNFSKSSHMRMKLERRYLADVSIAVGSFLFSAFLFLGTITAGSGISRPTVLYVASILLLKIGIVACIDSRKSKTQIKLTLGMKLRILAFVFLLFSIMLALYVVLMMSAVLTQSNHNEYASTYWPIIIISPIIGTFLFLIIYSRGERIDK